MMKNHESCSLWSYSSGFTFIAAPIDRERDTILQQLNLNLAKSQGFMKKFIDKKSRVVEFKIDNMVLLKLQLYRQTLGDPLQK